MPTWGESKANVTVYVDVVEFMGQFGVLENDHHVYMAAKEECLNYLTPS